MLLLIWLFLHGATGSYTTKFSGHEVKFDDNGVITSVKLISGHSDTLHIPDSWAVSIDQKAFNDAQHLKYLTVKFWGRTPELPPFVFLQLENLEVLHMISRSRIPTAKAFVGLDKLKKLIVTPGIHSHSDRTDYLGLPRTTNITFGSRHMSIPEELFENKLEPYRLVCINEKNYVMSLKHVDGLKNLRTAVRKCDRFDLIDNDSFERRNEIRLSHMRIRGFEFDWFGLDVGRSAYLDLSHNDIDWIQAEMLNHLPSVNWTVDLMANKLKALRKGYIINEKLVGLVLSHNSIEEIDKDALKYTSLKHLDVSHNQLNDNKFVKTLPPSMDSLYLKNNTITTLLPKAFRHLKKLTILTLDGNKLENLKKDVFKGLQNLCLMRITRKNLNNTTDSFHGLPDAIIRCLKRNKSDNCNVKKCRVGVKISNVQVNERLII